MNTTATKGKNAPASGGKGARPSGGKGARASGGKGARASGGTGTRASGGKRAPATGGRRARTPRRAAAPGPSTREAILERAVDVASTEGLEGLTIGRLAGELGMSKSGLFGHFGSKEELQLATIEAASRRFVAAVVEPALGEEPGRARLRALCDRYLDYLERPVFAGGCFWAAASAEFDDRPGPVRDAIRDALRAWLAGLEREARLAGAEDPAQLAFELHALAQGANSRARLLGDRAALRHARRAIERLLP